MKITKNLFTCLLLPIFFSIAPAAEDTRDCNFFVHNIQGEVNTWNNVYRDMSIEPRVADTQFLESYKQFYKKELHEYVTKYHSENVDALLAELEPGIDTVFTHLNSYYSMLEYYGQVCFGVSPETPGENIPDEYFAYIETIQNECRYLAMLILRHCGWGGGDNSLIGTEEHFDRIAEWCEKHLAPIPHLPSPQTDPTIARIASKLSENDMTQSAISFSMYEPEKLVVAQAFAYTNLLANMHLYVYSCPLRETIDDTPDNFGSKLDYSLAAALIIRQQDEWSKLMHFCFLEFFVPDCFGFSGNASGVLTEAFINRQLALLNYISGNLFYPMEQESAEEYEADSSPTEPEGTEPEQTPTEVAPLAQLPKDTTVKPGYLLPPFFLLFIGLLSFLLNRSTKQEKR